MRLALGKLDRRGSYAGEAGVCVSMIEDNQIARDADRWAAPTPAVRPYAHSADSVGKPRRQGLFSSFEASMPTTLVVNFVGHADPVT